MNDAATCHHVSSEPMTDALFPQAWVTGVTGESDITKPPLMTGDTSFPVPPYNARRRGEYGNSVTPVIDGPKLPLLPADRYITDRAQLGRCRRCQAPVIRADEGGWHTSVDPHRLTPLDELTEAAAGHRTFQLLPDQTIRGRPILRARFTPDIRTRPGRGLRQHRCDQPPTTPDPDLLARLGPATRTPRTTDPHSRIDPKAPF